MIYIKCACKPACDNEIHEYKFGKWVYLVLHRDPRSATRSVDLTRKIGKSSGGSLTRVPSEVFVIFFSGFKQQIGFRVFLIESRILESSF